LRYGGFAARAIAGCGNGALSGIKLRGAILATSRLLSFFRPMTALANRAGMTTAGLKLKRICRFSLPVASH
jgi:hypothetical protein